ncbi:hypothetical protein [Streptomyces sp. NBC_01751]|uniref:hypothetical protein n=1 Tax=Streptomyces sp. NBC_01751 TaxID=2975929 RepID=UPI002DD7E727|nr:hypothetical protein [Streptomyces sp. NBC_01751]WSD24575.1 hypothetical protein OHA26_14370 [Streptomyces sp. NBC_01751]
MRKLILIDPLKGISVGRIYRKWGRLHIPGRYSVMHHLKGSLPSGRTLSRREAIRTFQHVAKKGF